MNINPEYADYANNINIIGTRILTIVNKVSNKDMDTDEKIKNRYNNCLECISKFRDVKVTLILAFVPNIIKEEHKELIDTIQKFIT
jgi:hypothetical protein